MYVGQSVNRDRQARMPLDHSTRIDGQVGWLFSRPRSIGWYVGRSTNLDGETSLLISQSARIDRLICWSYNQPS